MTRESIRARVAAAAPGPWEVGKDGFCVYFAPVWEGPEDDPYLLDHHGLIYDEGGHTEADAAFIAASRTDIERLLAVADAAAVVEASHRKGLWSSAEFDALTFALAALEATE